MSATDGAAPSAFDRLFHRLVVAGDRPVVRKKKKGKTGKKPPVATTPQPREAPAAPHAVTPPVASPVDALAVACVRRLRLVRNLRRRLAGRPRDAALRSLAATGGHQTIDPPSQIRVNQTRRRRISMALPTLSTSDRARRYMRLEAIAARLFSRCVNAPVGSTESVCGASEWRVLHDFRFPLAGVAFQSRAHYESGSQRMTASVDVVPTPPLIRL